MPRRVEVLSDKLLDRLVVFRGVLNINNALVRIRRNIVYERGLGCGRKGRVTAGDFTAVEGCAPGDFAGFLVRPDVLLQVDVVGVREEAGVEVERV